jgi:hypothetical protein
MSNLNPQTSTSTAMTSPATTIDLNLFCLIKGDREVFGVKTDINRVDDLKDKIKRKCENGVLKGVDAKDLELWKVRHP